MSKTAKDFLMSNQLPPLQEGMAMYSKEEVIRFMESYHASKLSEVKGLPSEDAICLEFANHSEYDEIINAEQTGKQIGSIWMLQLAQQVIAKKDEELNKAKEEIERLKAIIKTHVID